MDTFGTRLKQKLSEKDMSAADVARAMNISNRQNVTAWINGVSKPKADDLALLAKILGTSVDWLLTGVVPRHEDSGTISIPMQDYIEYLNLKNEKLERENKSLKNPETVPVKQ